MFKKTRNLFVIVYGFTLSQIQSQTLETKEVSREFDFVTCDIVEKKLFNEIKRFDIVNKDFAKKEEKAILVRIDKKADTVVYQISYLFQYYDLPQTLPHIKIQQIANVNRRLVFINFRNITEVKIPDTVFLEIGKQRFKEDFEYYKEYNMFPLGSTYHYTPFWLVTYVDDVFVSREMDRR